MGKGDKKTKKGKQWRKSYGNSRNRAAIKARLARGNSGPVPSSTEKKVEKPKARKKAKKKTESAA